MDSTLTGELDGAQWYLGLAGEEILLAALGLAIARTIGEGVVLVDVAGHSGSVPLSCTSAGLATATEALGAVHRSLSAGSSAPKIAAAPPAEIFFSYLGTEPGLRHALELRAYRADGLVQLDWWYDTRSFDALHRRGAHGATAARADRADVGGHATAAHPDGRRSLSR